MLNIAIYTICTQSLLVPINCRPLINWLDEKKHDKLIVFFKNGSKNQAFFYTFNEKIDYSVAVQ